MPTEWMCWQSITFYQFYVATYIAQTGSRRLAAQLPQNLSDFTVAPHVAAEDMAAKDMVGFDEKDEPHKMMSSFITFVFSY